MIEKILYLFMLFLITSIIFLYDILCGVNKETEVLNKNIQNFKKELVLDMDSLLIKSDNFTNELKDIKTIQDSIIDNYKKIFGSN